MTTTYRRSATTRQWRPGSRPAGKTGGISTARSTPPTRPCRCRTGGHHRGEHRRDAPSTPAAGNRARHPAGGGHRLTLLTQQARAVRAAGPEVRLSRRLRGPCTTFPALVPVLVSRSGFCPGMYHGKWCKGQLNGARARPAQPRAVGRPAINGGARTHDHAVGGRPPGLAVLPAPGRRASL
jgi:hypothetical protein